jgi:hypothetical protein
MTWFFEKMVAVSQPHSAKPVEFCLRDVRCDSCCEQLFFCDEGVGWLADGLCDSVEFHPELR